MSRADRDPESPTAPLNLLLTAVRQAARSLSRDLNELEQLQESPAGALAYAESGREQAREGLRHALLDARPAYGWCDDLDTEEGRDPRRSWLVQPVSGFANFTTGRPGLAMAAALRDRDRIEAAVILDPASGEIFSAGRELGARRDRFRLRVAGPVSDGAAIGAPLPGASASPGRRERSFRDAAAVAATGLGIRGTGSIALDLAWVAAGRLHGAWSYGPAGHAAEIGAFLVREAGGRALLAGPEAGAEAVSVAASRSAFDMLSDTLRAPGPPPSP